MQRRFNYFLIDSNQLNVITSEVLIVIAFASQSDVSLSLDICVPADDNSSQHLRAIPRYLQTKAIHHFIVSSFVSNKMLQ